MKEIPILFSGPMVKAILDGRKTQTRRILKANPSWRPDPFAKDPPGIVTFNSLDASGAETKIKLRWQPGDHLWVKETWMHQDGWYKDPKPNTYVEGAGYTWVDYRADTTYAHELELSELGHVWRPSIYMPQWASRITLKVESVRAQKLHDITEADAIAEGYPFVFTEGISNPLAWYLDLWEEINGEGSWALNPWVSKTTFEVIQ